MNKLFLFFLLLHFSVSAQMLDNREGKAFSDKPFFNTEFVRINKIQTLNGRFTYKKPGEVLRATEYTYVYKFDSIGRLTQSYETRRDDGTQDTTWNKYIYDQRNQLIEHLKGDPNGLNVITYTYDEEGRVIKEMYAREYRDSGNTAQRTVFNIETMRYETFGKQVKKTVFNSYELPYLQEFCSYNEMGYLIEKREQYLITNTSKTHHYEYNEKGLLSAIRSYKDNEEKPYEEFMFTYDEHGNIEEKQHHRNGVYITETEILYNENSGMMTYVITRDVATNFIMILGFKNPEFF